MLPINLEVAVMAAETKDSQLQVNKEFFYLFIFGYFYLINKDISKLVTFRIINNNKNLFI